ncbi:unnamed protein product [Fusarium fujikuroi]|nr:unnamed protein product [Fusarium fujikuroi]
MIKLRRLLQQGWNRHSYDHHVKCGLGLIAVRDVFVRALADSTAKSMVIKLEDSTASVEGDSHDGSYGAGDEVGNLTETFSWCKSLIATTGSFGRVVLCLFSHRGFALIASGAALLETKCTPRLPDTGTDKTYPRKYRPKCQNASSSMQCR